MLVPRCLTCGHTLAHIQLPYEEKVKAIQNDAKLTEAEVSAKIGEVLRSYGLKYCCNMRIMGYVDKIVLTQ